MVDGLHGFYDARGLFEEGLAVFGHLTQRLRDTPAAAPADCRADLLSGLLTSQAWFCWQVSRFEAGLTLAREAVDIAVAAEQPGRQAQALFVLASLEASSQRHGEAFQHYAESRALASAQGDAWCEALALRALDLFAHALGQNDQAELWLEEALAVCERSHDWRNHACALQSLGMVRASQGRYQDARRMCADGGGALAGLAGQAGAGGAARAVCRACAGCAGDQQTARCVVDWRARRQRSARRCRR